MSKKIISSIIKPASPEIDNKIKTVMTSVIQLIKTKHL